MVKVRAFVGAVGVLLIAAGAVLLVLYNLKVFQTCEPRTGAYGTSSELCTQSPVASIVGAVLAAVGLVVLLGAVLIESK